MRDGYRTGARAALPLAVALAGFGLSYGVLARSAGMGILAPIVMSATTFGGSAQFAAASVLGTGGGAAAAAVAAILLNSRYVPIGISVAPVSTGSFWRRLLRAQLVIDESWALGHLGSGRYDMERIVGAGVVLYGAWVSSTALGVVAGDLFRDPAQFGLDAAFPALFLALLVPQLGSHRAQFAAILGATIALVLVPLSAPGTALIGASAACLIGLRRS